MKSNIKKYSKVISNLNNIQENKNLIQQHELINSKYKTKKFNFKISDKLIFCKKNSKTKNTKKETNKIINLSEVKGKNIITSQKLEGKTKYSDQTFQKNDKFLLQISPIQNNHKNSNKSIYVNPKYPLKTKIQLNLKIIIYIFAFFYFSALLQHFIK